MSAEAAGLLPPRAATTLLGHERAEAAFLAAWRSGRLPHAWLVVGPAGIGKATLAFRIARFVLAEGAGAAEGSLAIPPDHPVFRRVASGGHSDLMTLSCRDGEAGEGPRTVIGVDAVRAVGRFLSLTAGEGRWRVVVVDTADELNANAANALLKILEEPPKDALILMVSNVPGRLLATVRSRCVRLALNRLPDLAMAELVGRLGADLAADDVRGLIRLSEGSIGRAAALLEADGLGLFREILALAGGLPRIDGARLHALGDRLGRRDAEAAYRTAMRLLLWWVARVARAAAEGEAAPGLAGGDVVAGEGEAARGLIRRSGVERLVEVWEKCARLMVQADSVNLDRKQVVLGAFHQLQIAMRA